MIKKLLCIPLGVLLITGCASNPNDATSNVGTQGLLKRWSHMFEQLKAYL